MDKNTPTDPEVAETKKKSWLLWKKFAVAGVIFLIVVGLAVGLGVGLTRNKDSDSDSDSDSSGSDSDSDNSSSDSTSSPPFNTTNLWQPAVNTSWQIVLSHGIVPPSSSNTLTPNVTIYDLDLYDNDASTFAALQARGIKVICYFSAGSYENYRDDKDDFDEKDLGTTLDGWPNEKWVNFSSEGVREIMRKRIRTAAEKGCDAIDPDNVDAYVSSFILATTQYRD